jgi:curved DNA-binding protein
MSVEFKNYYDVLGVAKTASDADIKKAFRHLARQYHPDVAKDKSAAEPRFKEINEANEVLSDPDKRRKYDELGANWNHPERDASQRDPGFRGGADAESEFHFDGTGFSDFFEQFFGGRGGAPRGFDSGGGSRPRGQAMAQNGQDIEGAILVTLDEVMKGSTRIIGLQRSDPRTGQTTVQNLRVSIPVGVREAQMIRLMGKGQEGFGGGAPGNLYLRVTFARHPDFRVKGGNLYQDLELTPWEAVLGATIQIPTLDGMVAMRIPPGTQAEREFRLRGKGLPTGNGTRGDLHAIVSIQVPAGMTSAEKILWEQLAITSTYNPRTRS